jgi:hypothetical protein
MVVALGFVLFILWRRRHRQAVEGVEEKLVTRVAAVEKKVTDTLVHTAGRIVRKAPAPEQDSGAAPAPAPAPARPRPRGKLLVVLVLVLVGAVVAFVGFAKRT